MEENDMIKVVTPLGGGISEVTSFSDAVAVLPDGAGVLVGLGQIFFAIVRHLNQDDHDTPSFRRRVEIPVIGRDGEITGVLWSNARPVRDEVAKSGPNDITSLWAAIECGLRLLECKSHLEGRQLSITPNRHAVRIGALATCEHFANGRIEHDEFMTTTTQRDPLAAPLAIRASDNSHRTAISGG